ncbi:hypothetical protein Q4491_19790 [Photobacterium sp. 2_MG-2023]|uniref:hypothetical protein n=1 Tax=Photobacterium sp. 2_MG-2023 TaxID=3062663 RepID=UPI0026E115C0|nr:hypothetical protein [Photobacterium sp. 2_MG-2023]MDO6583587.1 hypothetical protein [Photobacterium sp. 2_MG-2023]
MAFQQGKIQDEFLGCRRRERLQPARTTPKNKKGFLGTLYPHKECLARFKQGQVNHRTQARHTHQTTKMACYKGKQECGTTPKNKKASTHSPTFFPWLLLANL